MNSAPEQSLARFLEAPSRFLFFTGKGGVGKTSLACASAIALADRERRVLLVSTDPASNLDEVLGVRLNSAPTVIASVPQLSALNIDPAVAALAYREKLVGPYRGKLPDAIVRGMEEQLSGACTMEIAAFDEFSRLLGEPEATSGFDHVIFDTAPTGHTLRLLSLPGAWAGFLAGSATGNSCLGPLAGLEKQREIYERAVAALADGGRTTLVLVSRAQKAALAEAERTRHELAALGVRNQRLILNGLFEAVDSDPVALALQKRGAEALASAEKFLAQMQLFHVPLRPKNLVGIPALRALVAADSSRAGNFSNEGEVSTLPATQTLAELVDEIAHAGRGVVMTMGKGGVGKTTLAAAIATELARRGCPVHLSTTDPAAHIAAAAGQVAGMRVSRIDPQVETRAYVEQVMATAGKKLDANGRALLEEDLRSPCTEEIAVFRAFARTVAGGKEGFVVLDTAPTGHTLLLLDATESYHREIARKASDMPEEVLQLLPRLRDAEYTRVLIVALPEATPVHEAAMLQADLRRAQIEPFAWIINQSFAGSGSRDPLLVARGRGEVQYIREVVEKLSRRTALVPWVREEPTGPERLQQLFSPTSVLKKSPLSKSDPGGWQTVREGYKQIVTAGGSCCGPAPTCCGSSPLAAADLARHIGYSQEELAALPEGANLGLSCGNPNALAALQPGEVVLDLGAGGGFDVFIAGRKVGTTGRAIGVDMTAEMLDKARHNIASYRELTGLDNVEFRLGEIEHLPVADSSVDAVISNCVINLSPDKPQVWREIARVLRSGGRVAVSDLALLKPLPSAVTESVAALLGCVAGAALVSETKRMAEAAGLGNIELSASAAYVEGMVDWQDPLYQKIMAELPAGTKLSDYITSLEVQARKAGGEYPARIVATRDQVMKPTPPTRAAEPL